MTRDELNKAISEKIVVKSNKGAEFIVTGTIQYYGLDVRHETLIVYRKLKNGKLGRKRIADITTFTKQHCLI